MESACRAATELGLRRLGLLGTRFTMQGHFYPEVFSRAEITLVPPSPAEQDYVHDIYMRELVNGLVLPETRTRLLAIVARLQAEDRIDGLILGGTELPLILDNNQEQGIPFLDTTRIHVARIVTELLA